MAHSPKLEVYQIILKPRRDEDKSFRDLITSKLNLNNNDDDTAIMFSFFRHFLHEIDADEFISNDTKKKAFTAYNTTPRIEGETTTINIHSEEKIIEGTIEGGKYGLSRNKSRMGHKADKEPLHIDDIILDTFYFLLYLPFDSKYGILLLQSYSSDTISDIFNSFLSKLFSSSRDFQKPKIEKFIPKDIIQEFKQNGVVTRFSFTSRYVEEEMPGLAFIENDNEVAVSIVITTKKGIALDDLNDFRENIENVDVFGKQLSHFTNKKGYLINTEKNKGTPFKLNGGEIQPIIYLEGIVEINNGIPNFGQIKDFCFNLLEDTIKPEVYLRDAVQER